ncbi:MAG: DUF4168 domain-containing protein [Balneolaceae bacterium]|nr:MAG: DUF4168 domain-containing protein [Balneolaceae bacterium]
MKLFKSTLVAMATLLIATGITVAQVQQQAPPPPQQPELPTSADVSDDEILLLVNTINDLQPIEEKAQEKIEEALEEEGITLQRFQQMMMAMQNPQMAEEANVTDEEMEKLQTLQPALMQIQGEAEQEMIAKIEDNGFTIERYQGIIMGAQQDPDLMARLQSEMDDE